MSKDRLKNFCFTLNNYTEEDIRYLETFYNGYCVYLIYGKEIGTVGGTAHLQGYAQLKKQTRFNTIKKLLNKYHIEDAMGTPEQNKVYCSKDGNFIEFGELRTNGSNKSIKNGIREQIKQCKSYNEVLEIEGIEKYLKFAKEYYYSLDKRRPEDYKNIELRPFQEIICDYLDKEGTNREILFIVDKEGGRGKTFLCSYLLNTRDDIFVSENGKTADILYNYSKNLKKNILIDIKRSVKIKDINYGVLESLINPFFTSTKYESQTIIKPFKSNMVVFMNNNNISDLSNYLSKDRIKILNLDINNNKIMSYDEAITYDYDEIYE